MEQWEERHHEWKEQLDRKLQLLAGCRRGSETRFLGREMPVFVAKLPCLTPKNRVSGVFGVLSDRLLDAVIARDAIGARWGFSPEQTFYDALKSILEDLFDIEVLNVTEYDDVGEVFGRPDQVELDVIIQNGLLILCEIKFSMSKSDMVIFERKVRCYEKQHGRKANRALVISPMVEERARTVATDLGGHRGLQRRRGRDPVGDRVLRWRAHTGSRIEPIAVGERRWREDDASPILEIARREGQEIAVAAM